LISKKEKIEFNEKKQNPNEVNKFVQNFVFEKLSIHDGSKFSLIPENIIEEKESSQYLAIDEIRKKHKKELIDTVNKCLISLNF